MTAPGGLHFYKLTVRELRAVADDALCISFDVPAEHAARFAYTPGQHLTLRQSEGGHDVRRSYSICSAPGEALSVAVRRVPGGVFSSALHRHLRAGQVIDVMPPLGQFGAAAAARAVASDHHLGIAGGSGITPILSLLKTTLAQQPASRFTLLYGNRHLASTMFKETLEDLKNQHLGRFAVHWVFSREGVDSPLHSGRMDRHKITDFLRLMAPVDEAFVCGPHALNDEAEAALLAAGLAPAQVHIERFGVPRGPDAGQPRIASPEPSDHARLRIVLDGSTRELAFLATDLSILDAATRAGLDMPYACKSGVCATCKAKLLSGQVHMARNFALSPDEVAAGFVLTCQARPLTPEVMLSFDER